MTITPRFTKAREKTGLSLAQAARLGWVTAADPYTAEAHAQKAVGIARLTAIEAGNAKPTRTEIALLCDLYHVNEDWLLGGPGREVKPDDVHGLAWLDPDDAASVMELLRSAP